jgi:hypothetical protein
MYTSEVADLQRRWFAGGGNILGSILGGRYSDLVLRKLKKKNGGVGQPEMRLKSTVPGKPPGSSRVSFIKLTTGFPQPCRS